jgi:hypothetical protein
VQGGAQGGEEPGRPDQCQRRESGKACQDQGRKPGDLGEGGEDHGGPDLAGDPSRAAGLAPAKPVGDHDPVVHPYADEDRQDGEREQVTGNPEGGQDDECRRDAGEGG